jgi:hypothetical protein
VNTETAFALLGALIAVAVILLALVVFGGVVVSKLFAYVAHFKGFQGNRNAKNEMTFTAVIDETPPAPPRLAPVEHEMTTGPEALN